MLKKKMPTYNDGILTICEVKDRTIIKNIQTGVRYGEKTVGMSRFWAARVQSNTVDRLIVIPFMELKKEHLILINGEQYKILQIQQKEEFLRVCLYVSLEKIVVIYKDHRE